MKITQGAVMALHYIVSSQQLEDFLSGFYSTMFNKDADFSVIETCVGQDSALQTRFKSASVDLSSGDMEQMAQGAAATAAIFALADVDFIESCPALQDDGG